MAAEESCENYNIPCKRRQELLYDLGKALGGTGVPAPFWACVQVCDLAQLEVIVDNARKTPWFVSSFAKHCSHQIPLLWLQEPQESGKYSASTSTSTSTSISSLTSADADGGPPKRPRRREPIPTEAADERDEGSCVFRRSVPIDAAPIYPHFNQEDHHSVKFLGPTVNLLAC